MLCDCGGKTYVVNTRQMPESIRRQRKCASCKQSFYTLESRMEEVQIIPAPVKKPAEKPMAQKAADVHRKRVEIRRKNEDHKMRVPSYFIEDEEDY